LNKSEAKAERKNLTTAFSKR